MRQLPPQIVPGQPLTALAPMQDVTDLPFMRTLGPFGAPDYFFTEYFRVHVHSTLERHIVDSILQHGTGRPVFAQIIGESLEHIERTMRELARLPIAGIDLNMGCPAPKVFKKNVGGGLLREPAKVAGIFRLMRATAPTLFTAKMRVGFEDARHFDELLSLVNEHGVDLLSLHARTVRQLYRGEPDYSWIRHAARTARCPVLANGNITSADKAVEVLAQTGAAGVMIGRSAIRNPWIFRQCRERFSGGEIFRPRMADVRAYVDCLWAATAQPGLPELCQVPRMKKLLNFVGQGVDPEGSFLKEMRRTVTYGDLMRVCDAHLVENGRAEMYFASEPHANVLARPNHEGPEPDDAELPACSL